ncbi:MAG: hypothetical protein KAJ51_01580 [Thermoplasmata archaeon]|nr:hypothetical protein [Thermoplasmata archaeon]
MPRRGGKNKNKQEEDGEKGKKRPGKKKKRDKKKSMNIPQAREGFGEMNELLNEANSLIDEIWNILMDGKLPDEAKITELEDLLKKVKALKFIILDALILRDLYDELKPIDDLIDQAKNLAILLRITKITKKDPKKIREEIKKLLKEIKKKKEKLEKKLPKPKGKKRNSGFYIMNRWIDPMIKHYVDDLSSEDLEWMINKIHSWKKDAIQELPYRIGAIDLFFWYWFFREIDKIIADILSQIEAIKDTLGPGASKKAKIDTTKALLELIKMLVRNIKLRKEILETILPKK